MNGRSRASRIAWGAVPIALAFLAVWSESIWAQVVSTPTNNARKWFIKIQNPAGPPPIVGDPTAPQLGTGPFGPVRPLVLGPPGFFNFTPNAGKPFGDAT